MIQASCKLSLSDLSARFELELRGDGDHMIDGIGTLVSAGSGQVSFLANRAYARDLPQTGAGAVILKADDAEKCPTNCLVAGDPYLAFARVAALFDPRPGAEPGIHPTAVVSGSARLGEGVSVGPNSVIGDRCVVGDGCVIGPGTVLEPECTLDEACRLYANVTLGFGVFLGKRVIVHPGAVIGADGFGIAFAGDHWEKVPQLGTVRIGDDSEIGANSCIDRGAIEDTVLEEDVRIDNLVQVAHNVHIGAHSALAGRSAIAGSTRIGRYCLIGGGAGVSGHLDVADRTTLGGTSYIYQSVREPGQTLSGTLHAWPAREWQKNLVRLQKLNELAKTVKQLEKKLGKLDTDE